MLKEESIPHFSRSIDLPVPAVSFFSQSAPHLPPLYPGSVLVARLLDQLLPRYLNIPRLFLGMEICFFLSKTSRPFHNPMPLCSKHFSLLFLLPSFTGKISTLVLADRTCGLIVASVPSVLPPQFPSSYIPPQSKFSFFCKSYPLFCCCSVTQSCPALCDPMDYNMPGFPVHHQILELSQTHAHQVGDAIQPSHPLLSPSPPVFNLSQHQGLFR